MTAFDLFQIATVQIGEGNRASAVATLARAIKQIDLDGIDSDMREDIASLQFTVKSTSTVGQE